MADHAEDAAKSKGLRQSGRAVQRRAASLRDAAKEDLGSVKDPGSGNSGSFSNCLRTQHFEILHQIVQRII